MDDPKPVNPFCFQKVYWPENLRKFDNFCIKTYYDNIKIYFYRD